MNRKGQSVAIGVLVFLTLLVTVTMIFYIVSKESNLNKDFYVNNVLDKTYEKEKLVDFYLERFVEGSAEGVSSEKEFFDNFKLILEGYKIEEMFVVEEFENLESSLRLEDIELINEEIIVSFDFSIDNYLKKREWKIEKEIDDNDRFALTRQQIKDELWGREEPVLISSKFRYQKSFVGKI